MWGKKGRLLYLVVALVLTLILVSFSFLGVAKESGKLLNTYSDGSEYNQDFSWGVLALNSDKNVYESGEEVHFHIGVLDNFGEMECSADLVLDILGPDGNQVVLSTKDNSIIVSSYCSRYGAGGSPDFYSSFFPKSMGVYTVNLTASTSNGVRSIERSFSVEKDPALEVSRFARTRIYPVSENVMKIKVNQNSAYSGVVVERVPKEITILSSNGAEYFEFEDYVELRWTLNTSSGESSDLVYVYDAPDYSPEYYEFGPLMVGENSEERSWQIASDLAGIAPDVVMLSGAGGDVGSTTDVNITWTTSNRVDGSSFTHDNSSNTHEVVIQQDGVYRFNYGLYITTTDTAGTDARYQAVAHLQVNGVNSGACYGSGFNRGDSNGLDMAVTSECLVNATVGDVIAIVARQESTNNAGNTKALTAGSSWLHGQRVDEPQVLMLRNTVGGDSYNSVRLNITYDEVNQSDEVFNYTSGSSEIEVLQDGFYRVTYGVGVTQTTNTRAAALAYLEHQPFGGSFNSVPYGWAHTNQRGNRNCRDASLSASTILNLSAQDRVRLQIAKASSASVTSLATVGGRIHFDMEYLGDLNYANVLQVYDAAGGDDIEPGPLDQTWDTRDVNASDFHYTPTGSGITVQRDGLYHVSYGIFTNRTASESGRFEYVTSLRVDGADQDVCYGSGYNRGDQGDEVRQGGSESSCLIELNAGQVVSVRSTETSTNTGTVLTGPNQVWLTMQSMDFPRDMEPPLVTINVPQDGLTYGPNDFPLDFNVSLNEEGTVEFTLDGGTTNLSMDTTDSLNFNYSNSSIADGAYTFEVYATDILNNINDSESTTFAVDLTAPVISLARINETTPVALNTVVRVNASVIDASSNLDVVVLEVNPPTSATFNTTVAQNGDEYFNDSIVLSEDGFWQFRFFANDTFENNASPVSATDDDSNAFIEIDTTIPVLSFEVPTEDSGVARAQDYVIVNTSVVDTHFNFTLVELFNGTTLQRINFTVSNETPFFVNFSGLADGFYLYNATANDSVGNIDFTETRNITLNASLIDTQPPLVTITTPVNGSFLGVEDFPVTFEVVLGEDGDTVLYNINDSEVNVTMGTGDLRTYSHVNSSLSDGTYLFQVYANDTSGNANNSVTSVFFVDTNVPVISNPSVNASSPVALNTVVKVNASITDSGGTLDVINLEIDGPLSSPYNLTPGQIGDEYFNDSILLDEHGDWQFTFHVNDTAGNVVSAVALDLTASNVTEADGVDPSASYVSPTQTSGISTNDASIAVNVSASDDNLDTILVELFNDVGSPVDQGSSGTSPYFVNFTGLSDGTYFYNVTVNDTVGNEAILATRDTTVDLSNPLVTINLPVDGVTYGTSSFPLVFNVSLNESGSVVSFSLNDSSGENVMDTTDNLNYNYSNSSIPDGTYLFQVLANDSVGNRNDSESVSFTVDQNPPRLTKVRINDSSIATLGTVVQVNATATDDGTGVEDVVIEVQPPISATYNLSTQSSGSHYFNSITLNEEGRWAFRVYANDTLGNTVSSFAKDPFTYEFIDVEVQMNTSTGFFVQSGVSTVTSTNDTISINATNHISRSFVMRPHYYSASPDTAAPSTGNTITPVYSLVSTHMSDTDAITVLREASTENLFVDWMVVEAMNKEFGVIRGEYSWDENDGTQIDIDIGTEVDPNATFAYVTTTVDSSDLEAFDTSLFMAHMSNETNLRVERNVADSATTGTLQYIVVVFDTSKIDSIQSGTASVTSQTLQAPLQVTLPTTIDIDQSILLFQLAVGDSGLDQVSAAGRIADNTTLEFYRFASSQQRDIRWYVIDFGSGAGTKLNGTDDYSTDLDQYQLNATLSPSIQRNRTLFFGSSTNDGTGTAFPRPFWTLELVNDSGLEQYRSRFDQEHENEWQVLELPYVPPNPPMLTYESPTLVNGTNTTNNFIVVNVSAIDENLDTITISLFDNTSSLVNSDSSTSNPHLFNFTGLADGRYYFNASANDTTENNGYLETREVVVDTSAPLVDDLIPVLNTQYSDSALIEIAANVTDLVGVDAVYVEISMPNGTVTNETLTLGADNKYNVSYAIPGALGAYNITFFANDSLGNLNSTEMTNFSLDDVVPPMVTIGFPVNETTYGPNNFPLNFSVSLSELGSIVEFSLNDSFTNITMNTADSLSYYYENSSIPDGTYLLQVFANDTSNNRNDSQFVTFSVDQTGPVVMNATIDNSSALAVNSIVKVNATIVDAGLNLDSVTLEVIPPISAAFNTTTSQSGDEFVNDSILLDEEGQWQFRFFANDTLGNNASELTAIANDGNLFVETDATGPIVNYVTPTQNSGSVISASSVSVNVSATDSYFDSILVELFNSGLSQINSSTSSSNPYFINFTGLSDGLYYYNTTANDTVGNLGYNETRTITLDTTAPLVFNLTPTLNSTYGVGIQVVFSVNATDIVDVSDVAGVDSVIAQISMPNGTIDNQSLSYFEDAQYNFTYVTQGVLGTYDVTFVVNDTVGNVNSSQTTNFTVSDLNPPLVTINFPVNGTSYGSGNLPLNFSVTLDETGSEVLFSLDNATTNLTMNTSDNLNYNYTNGTIADGNYVFQVFAFDAAGNLNNTEFVSFSVDQSGPTIENATINDTSFVLFGSTVKVNATVYDNFSVIDTVLLEVTPPDNVAYNTTLAQNGDEFFNDSIILDQDGEWVFTFYANDTFSEVSSLIARDGGGNAFVAVSQGATGYQLQHGTDTISATEQNISIPAVEDLSRAFVMRPHYYSGSPDTSTASGSNDLTPDVSLSSVYLSNVSTITVNREVATEDIFVDWIVWEAVDEEFEVFRGEYNWADTDGTEFDVDIGASVDPNATISFVTTSGSSASHETWDTTLFTSFMINATHLRFNRGVADSGVSGTLRYVVVEFNTSKLDSLESGTSTLTNQERASPLQTTLNTPVNPDESIMFFQIGVADSGLSQTSVSGRLADNNTLEFYALNDATQRDIRWYVLDFGEEVGSKQNDTEDYSTDTTQSQLDITLSPSVEINRTIYFHSTTTDGSGLAFPRPSWYANLTSSSNLRLYRSRTNQEHENEWQVLELPFTSPELPDKIPPNVSFAEPTPENDHSTENDYIEINSTINESELNFATINWNGTSYNIYDTSLVLMYNFDNVAVLGDNYTACGNVVDLSLGGNNGTPGGVVCSNSSRMPEWYSPGRYNGALNFTGNGGLGDTGQLVLVNDSANLNPGADDFAIAFWIKPGQDRDGDIVVKGSASSGASTWYKLEHSPDNDGEFGNNISFDLNTDGTDARISAGPYEDEEWHFVLAQKKGSVAELWIDGELQGCDTATGACNGTAPVSGSISNSANLVIGAIDTMDDDFLNSSLDEIRMYSNSFEEDEVLELYYSNLNKYGVENWALFVNQSNLIPGDYSYFISGEDADHNVNFTEFRSLTKALDVDFNVTSIGISNYNPVENESITINATIENVGTNNTQDLLISFVINDNATNFTMDLDRLAKNSTEFTVPMQIGVNNITVIVDADNTYNESNEINNQASDFVNVSIYDIFLFNLSFSFNLSGNISSSIFTPEGSVPIDYIIVADDGATIDFSEIQPLSRTMNDTQATADFNDTDVLIGNLNVSDSFNALYANGADVATQNQTMTIFDNEYTGVPIINSTLNASTQLYTAVFWDTSDDTGNYEFDTTDQEDLFFVGNYEKNTTTEYGVIDGVIKFPSLLRKYKDSNDLVEVFVVLS